MPVAKVIQVVRASREAKSLDMPVDQSGSPDAADSPALVDTLASDLGDTAEDSSQRCVFPHRCRDAKMASLSAVCTSCAAMGHAILDCPATPAA